MLHDLTAFDAGAGFDQRITSDPMFGVDAESALHFEGGVDGALGVILTGDRSAEDGVDAVPGRLHDDTVECQDAVDHDAKHGVQQAVGVFWVEGAEESDRVLDVGE